MIIGTSKGIDKLPILAAAEVDELHGALDAVIKAGQPLEIPIGLPTELVGRAAVTLTTYRALLQELDVVRKHIADHAEQDIADSFAMLMSVAKKADALVNAEKPKPRRVVLPGLGG